MENLAHLQSWLRWVITHPNGVQPALNGSANLNLAEPLPRAFESIVEAPPLDRVSRLDIYAEGYFARLVEVLTDDFEHFHRALTTLFDEMAFNTVVSAYVAANPSRTRTVCDVGQFLPTFLQTFAPLADFPYLAEIAEMDWLATRTLYIDSLPAFDPNTLSGLSEDDWVQLRFELDPTVQLQTAEHTIDRAWNEAQFSMTMIESDPTQLVIFRFGELVHVERIAPFQLQVLKRMQEGKTLGEICEELEAQVPSDDDMPPIMEWFSQWVSNGVIRTAKI